MNKARVQHFTEKLEAEKALLEDELNSLGRKDGNGDWEAIPEARTETEGDEGDQAGRNEELESKNARITSLDKRYRQVTAALDRVANGTYGICLKSGKLIEEDRLEANPAAETCKEMMNK